MNNIRNIKIMTRCCARTKTNKSYKPLCKKIASFQINNYNYCWIHANIIFSNKCTIIQKIYRGHYCRSKLKRLFIDLPRDCQKLILFHIEKDFYYRRYINTIQKILSKKYTTYTDSLLFNYNVSNGLVPIYEHYNILRNIYNTYSSFNSCKECAPENLYNELRYAIKNGWRQRNYLRNITTHFSEETDEYVKKIQEQHNIMMYGFDRGIKFI